MSIQNVVDDTAKFKARERLYGLLTLQQTMVQKFGESNYNVFIFGSYLTTRYVEGESDIDIAIYTEDFELYKCLSVYLEEYFNDKGIDSDIFYIDTMMEAPIYCAPLKSQVQFTDYYPERLVRFRQVCQRKLEETKARVAG
ncbi:MAG: nucleotidyltransferase domain-containing protein [Lachnospiraceae bacterium]|nr:nucleotidyltransferase domain-containing protein [Lachnospiraceae bacterium]